ncbi:hypothetical protein [Enhygromyxa salina]|nr:hypothetical protein [Enhygromyxa salina]
MSEVTPVPKPESKPKREMGAVGMISMLIGFAILAVTVLSAANTAFDLNLALGSHGATSPLPNNWEAVIGLGAAGVLWIALTYFGSTVVGMFKDAKGNTGKRVGVIVGALVLLVVAGRGLQVVALTWSYGSMLAYYCTDVGTIEDVQDELEGATPEALDACLGRTSQWDRADLLEVVIGAGATFEDATTEPEFRYCVLSGDVSLEYVEKAVALGATPQNCPKSESLIQAKVSGTSDQDDETMAKIVAALLAAGWSADAVSEFDPVKAVEHAKQRNQPATLAVLEGAQ